MEWIHFKNTSLILVKTIIPVNPPEQVINITFQKLKSNKVTAIGTDILPKPRALVKKTETIFQNSAITDRKIVF